MFKVKNKGININPYKSGHPEVFCEKSLLKNFLKFRVKHLPWQSIFSEVACMQLYYNKEAMVDISQWVLQKLSEPFYRIPVIVCFCPF